MKDMSKFQLIVTGVFAGFILLGVLAFSLYKGGSSVVTSDVLIWGTLSTNEFNTLIEPLAISKDKTVRISYVQKTASQFDNDFINALASGVGPDLFFLSQDSILKYKDKIFIIPYKSYSERVFKDTFIQEGELYLDSVGVLALPFTIDPLVMYWNRDIFTNIEASQPPKYWDDFYPLIKNITKRDASLNILKSAISFGEFKNVYNSKEIISALLMQSGTLITSTNNNGVVNSVLTDKNNTSSAATPAESAISFYTNFANPVKDFYSWNRSMSSSQNSFLSGDLAVYFGLAGELFDLRAKNPNLNFDVASFPQIKNASVKITFGKMNALAINKNSKSVQGAFTVAMALTAKDSIDSLTNILNLPPVRRDSLAGTPADAYMSTFYSGAIASRGWLDPDKNQTAIIFQEMIESITGGRSNVFNAVSATNEKINILLNNRRYPPNNFSPRINLKYEFPRLNLKKNVWSKANNKIY